MATCRNCFHFEVCDSGRHIGEYIEDDGIYSDDVEKECATFKNAADVAEVKHGEWLHLCGDEWFCTNCGEVIGTEGSWEKPTKKYCNECGAKMDGGEEE